jgi:hypothetical protein
MKTILVKKLETAEKIPALSRLSVMMDEMEKQRINTLNWKDYGYKPDVQFSISYSDSEIFLKYYVREEYFKAEMTESNQNVYEDSCVEFFFSPEDDGTYYNLEINGIGTCLLGSGTGRADTKRADPEIISKIRRLSYPWNKPSGETKGDISWSVTVAIPFEVFFRHKVKELKGKSLRANFYKCGDKLTVPHYVTWNPIGTENPDYHRPEYFGMLKFV